MVDASRTWKRMGVLQQDTLIAGALTVAGWLQATLIWFALREPRPHMDGPPGFDRPEVPLPFARPVPAPTPLALLLVLACFMPLALRRRYPIPVLIVVSLASAIYDFSHAPPVMTVVAVILALYTVGTMYGRRALVWASAAAIAITLLGTAPQFGQARWYADALLSSSILVAAAAFGDATRNRRQYVAEVEQRAAEAERTRDEEAKRRVDEERLRIARELHDVTAHSLSIIAVQSGAAQRVVETDPEAARRALGSIRTTASTSLDELRAMLGVLRHAEDGTPLAPTPRLSQIDQLAESVRNAGIEVDIDADDTETVPSVAQASAYRVIQEALTNVVRHAHATRAEVSVKLHGDELVLDVADDGTGPTSRGEGHGIPGMRERVTALGGTFLAGARDAGGFVVHATIPLPRRQDR